MKHIAKNKEPKELTTYRSTPKANYDSAPKPVIRKSLIEEQGYICAYCMQRIGEDWDANLNKYKTEIEHYKSQHRHPELTLIYNNMLGVCNGNAKKPNHLIHCDKKKSEFDTSHDLSVNPLDRRCETEIKFLKNGKIYSDIPEIEYDLNEILNLNEQNLMNNRQLAIQTAFQNLISVHGNSTKKWNVANVKKEKAKWEKQTEGKFRPYCQAVIYHLNKKIQQLASQ